MLILLAFLLVLVTAAVVTYFQPREYQSSAFVEVRSTAQNPHIFGQQPGGDPNQPAHDPTLAPTGPPLVFERLWRDTACGVVLQELLANRDFAFPVERAVFLTVLHRLMVSGSDRACEQWRADYRIDGTEDLRLHHLYWAMTWLGEELPVAEQTNHTLAPRCIKDRIEEELFARRRDLFTDLSVVFMDTTSLYFEGEGGATLGERGHSKDYRPHLNQMIVGVIIDQHFGQRGRSGRLLSALAFTKNPKVDVLVELVNSVKISAKEKMVVVKAVLSADAIEGALKPGK